jgi:hypothetical protein
VGRRRRARAVAGEGPSHKGVTDGGGGGRGEVEGGRPTRLRERVGAGRGKTMAPHDYASVRVPMCTYCK